MIIENLEKRTHLSATIGSNGQLLVTDTTGDDTIVIKKVSSNITVAVNSVVSTFLASKIKSIKVTSSKGNDKITVDKSISLPATLVGGTGNDSLYGGAGNNNITGGSANNLLVGGDQYDYINGGAGSSTIQGNAGSDSLVGGTGDNTYVFNPTYSPSLVTINQKANGKLATLDFSALASNEPLTVDLTRDFPIAGYSWRLIRTASSGQAARFGNVIGGAGAAVIVGNASANTLIGGGGTTSLVAGAGLSTLQAGAGKTTFVFGPKTASLVAQTPLIDTVIPNSLLSSLDFSSMPSNIGVNVDLTSDSMLAKYPGRVLQTGAPGQAAWFATVLGGAGNDVIKGNAVPNYLSGIAGSDIIIAGSANSSLIGGRGNTSFVFVPQATPVVYRVDQDTKGTNGFDFSALPADNPVTVDFTSSMLAYYTNVTIQSYGTDDAEHLNTVTGGAGDDSITANNYGDTIYVGTGNATVNGGTGKDFIDVLTGTGADLIRGNGGGDIIIAADGDSTIYGTNESDDPTFLNFVQNTQAVSNPAPIQGATIIAGAGNDSIVGTNGDDVLEGGGGYVTIHGLAGNDYIQGGQQESKLFGDDGNDTIYGGPAMDIISQGDGNDEVHAGDGGNFIDKNLPDNEQSAGTGEGSYLDLSAITDAAIAYAQGYTDGYFPVVIESTPGNSPATFTDPETGATRNPWLYDLIGPSGDTSGDSIDGGTGDTTVIGGKGNDSLFGGNGNSTIVAGSGNAAITGGDGQNFQQGGAGSDTFASGEGEDTMHGGTGDSIFNNDNGYANTLIGGNGINSAQVDPTGQTYYQNIQVYTLVDQQPFSEGEGPATFGDVSVATPATASLGDVTPAISGVQSPAFVDVNHNLQIGSTSYTGDQALSVAQNADGSWTTNIVGIGIQSFPASAGILGVLVFGGPGNDYADLRNLHLPSLDQQGDGNNTLLGGTNNDTVYNGSGNDTITELSGNNVIYSGLGNDTITGGSGSDWINPGGYGFFQSNVASADSIIGGSGTEYLDYNYNTDNMNIRLDKGTITDTVTGVVSHITNIHKVFAGSGAAVYMVGDKSGKAMLTAGSGNDTMFGIGATDYLCGGPGNDMVFENGTKGILQLKAQHNNNTNKHKYNTGGTTTTAYFDATCSVVAKQTPTP